MSSEQPDTTAIRAKHLPQPGIFRLPTAEEFAALLDALDATRAESTRDLKLAVDWHRRTEIAQARITVLEGAVRGALGNCCGVDSDQDDHCRTCRSLASGLDG